MGEWGTAGAILREQDIGLASASKKDPEDAATEDFPSTREACGSEAWLVHPDPCPWAGVSGPVISMLVGKTRFQALL